MPCWETGHPFSVFGSALIPRMFLDNNWQLALGLAAIDQYAVTLIKGGAVRVHCTVCAVMNDPQETYRSVVVALLYSGLYMLCDAIAKYLIRQALFEVWFQ